MGRKKLTHEQRAKLIDLISTLSADGAGIKQIIEHLNATNWKVIDGIELEDATIRNYFYGQAKKVEKDVVEEEVVDTVRFKEDTPDFVFQMIGDDSLSDAKKFRLIREYYMEEA